eukprot:2296797-Amphidinium_carterae.1
MTLSMTQMYPKDDDPNNDGPKKDDPKKDDPNKDDYPTNDDPKYFIGRTKGRSKACQMKYKGRSGHSPREVLRLHPCRQRHASFASSAPCGVMKEQEA